MVCGICKRLPISLALLQEGSARRLLNFLSFGYITPSQIWLLDYFGQCREIVNKTLQRSGDAPNKVETFKCNQVAIEKNW